MTPEEAFEKWWKANHSSVVSDPEKCWLAAWSQGRAAGLLEAADISAKLYSIFGKQHPKRQCGKTLSEEFRRRAAAGEQGR